MTVERYIRIFAGIFILASLALGIEGSPLFVSSWALAFTAFVGANLFQFGFTNSALWVGCCANWGCLMQLPVAPQPFNLLKSHHWHNVAMMTVDFLTVLRG
jgi:hypothetical protein